MLHMALDFTDSWKRVVLQPGFGWSTNNSSP